MKIRIQLFTLVLCLVVAASCKKKTEDPTPVNPTPAAGTFTCKLSGMAWSADSAVYINNGTQTFIMAYKAGRMQFEINLSGVTAKSYPVSAGNDFIYWPELTSFSGAIDGSIVIPQRDKKQQVACIGEFGLNLSLPPEP